MFKLKFIGRVLVWLPAIFMAITIFGFSAQNGNESQGVSNRAAGVILTACDNLGIINFVDANNKEELIENIQYPIRKIAHITEYAIFTMCIFIALMIDGLSFRWSRIICLLMVIIYASFDEIHQLFVVERAGRFIDVCFDTFGALVFLGIVSIIHHILEKKREDNIFSELE